MTSAPNLFPKWAEVEYIGVDVVQVGDRLRAVNEQTVSDIARSMQVIGMVNPITVRVVFEDPTVEPADSPNHIEVVAGAHRLAAAKRIGMKSVPAIYISGDETDAKLWEIAENLHRAELTVAERAEHISEYARLTEEKVAQLAPLNERGRGHKTGERETARQLGLERRDVQRSKTIAAIAPEAKAAAKDAGLDDNQSALLKVAAEPTPEAQVAKVVEITTEKKNPRKPRQSTEQRKEEALSIALHLIEGTVAGLLSVMKPSSDRERRDIFAALRYKLDSIESNTEESAS